MRNCRRHLPTRLTPSPDPGLMGVMHGCGKTFHRITFDQIEGVWPLGCVDCATRWWAQLRGIVNAVRTAGLKPATANEQRRRSGGVWRRSALPRRCGTDIFLGDIREPARASSSETALRGRMSG